MNATTVADFIAVVLLAATAGTVSALAVPALRQSLVDAAVPLTALVAAGAMAGSLWFSESAGFVPCELCWYQRIAMYPIAVVGTVAAIRGDRSFRLGALILAGAGLVVALYHVQLQLWPDQSSFCALDTPCTGSWVEGLGFMTIPQMAALCFAIIVGINVAALTAGRPASFTSPPEDQ